MLTNAELAKQGRAGCTDGVCKNDAIKIAKGELRFGTWVVIKDHGGWKWRHWGCVTWKQIQNWKEATEHNPELIDGMEEIDAESQRKVLQAYVEGRVAMEDWKHEPELNEIGASTRKPKPKPKPEVEEHEPEAGSEAGSEIEAEVTPSKKRKAAEGGANRVKTSKRRRKVKKDENNGDVDESAPESTNVQEATATNEEILPITDEEEEKPKKRGRKAGKASKATGNQEVKEPIDDQITQDNESAIKVGRAANSERPTQRREVKRAGKDRESSENANVTANADVVKTVSAGDDSVKKTKKRSSRNKTSIGDTTAHNEESEADPHTDKIDVNGDDEPKPLATMEAPRKRRGRAK